MLIPYNLIWLRGIDCDGCTIAALGDQSGGGLDGLLTAPYSGRFINFIHPGFALESGDTFVEQMRMCARGEAGPYALLVETSLPSDPEMSDGWYGTLGEEHGVPVTLGSWLDRLAPSADFVLALGDCAVWGGPHSIGDNPTGSFGVARHLGLHYRSRLDLPVVNLPGCAVPGGLVALVADFVAFASGAAPQPALDEFQRPASLYQGRWKGALALWQA